MKKIIFLLAVLLIACTNQKKKNDYLVKVFEGRFDEISVKTGYINSKKDTVIPFGKYYYCYTDTIINYGIVQEKNGKLIAIDPNENILFEVYNFDNGPDTIKEDRFRIIKNGKIGYANSEGKIVIEPIYKCAFPFSNGKARVAVNCELKKNGEHTMQSSDQWIFINVQGEEVEK
ncbi:WG repeat-containing protein [Flavobacteriaceae bacterium R38]|nr:WG repeat-containing protein [Flavobacteriaceae bacterium R38]